MKKRKAFLIFTLFFFLKFNNSANLKESSKKFTLPTACTTLVISSNEFATKKVTINHQNTQLLVIKNSYTSKTLLPKHSNIIKKSNLRLKGGNEVSSKMNSISTIKFIIGAIKDIFDHAVFTLKKLGDALFKLLYEFTRDIKAEEFETRRSDFENKKKEKEQEERIRRENRVLFWKSFVSKIEKISKRLIEVIGTGWEDNLRLLINEISASATKNILKKPEPEPEPEIKKELKTKQDLKNISLNVPTGKEIFFDIGSLPWKKK